jgi:ubiquinone/menaquinone biosynthesis C-methylase UbiE
VYTNILDHITPRDVFLCEVARVLKLGGSFLNFVDQGKPDSYSVHDYRSDKEVDLVRNEMKRCGLTVVRELRHVPGMRKRRVLSTHSKRGTVEFVMEKSA